MYAIVALSSGSENVLRVYDVNTPQEARDQFVKDWLGGVVTWEYYEFWNPKRPVAEEASLTSGCVFTPEFIRGGGPEADIEDYDEATGIATFEWWCITGIHGSDEHFVSAYCIPYRAA